MALAQPAEAEEGSALAALARAGGLALVLLATGLVLRQAGPAMLHDVKPTPAGAALLVLAGGGLTAVGLPRQAVAFAGGYAFGAWPGLLLSLLAQMLGCAADYAAAHTVAGAWAKRRLANSRGKHLARIRTLLNQHPFTTTLTLRLLPVGNNLALNLLAGVAAIRATPFLLGSLLGYLPQTAIFTLLGSGIQVGHGTELTLACALFALSALLGFVLWRRVGRIREGS